MYSHGSITVDSCIPMVHFSHHEKTCFFLHVRNKGADQLCGKHAADQSFCCRYINRTIPILS